MFLALIKSFYDSFQIKPFVPNAPFFYPLKTSQNRKVFWCFQGVEKECIGNKWVKSFQANVFFDARLKYQRISGFWCFQRFKKKNIGLKWLENVVGKAAKNAIPKYKFTQLPVYIRR